MKTFADVQAQIETINNIANLGDMALTIYPKQFNYLEGELPPQLLPVATGNKFNSNKAVPGAVVRQYDARINNQVVINHLEINDLVSRLTNIIDQIEEKEAFNYHDSFYIIHDVLSKQ